MTASHSPREDVCTNDGLECIDRSISITVSESPVVVLIAQKTMAVHRVGVPRHSLFVGMWGNSSAVFL